MTYRGRHEVPRPSRRQGWLGGVGIASVLAVAAGFVVFQPIPPGQAVADGRGVTATRIGAADAGPAPTTGVATAAAPSMTAPLSADTTPGATATATVPSTESTRDGASQSAPKATGPARLRPVSVARPAQPCSPTGLAIEALGINARVVPIGLERDGSLGVPSESDRASAGWYPSVLAGAPQGTVLMDGHTYRDGSAIFTTDSPRQAHLGMMLRVSCDKDTVVSYRLSELHLDLSPDDYPGFVSRRRLYAVDGPPQLVIITCTGWNTFTREWDHRAILVATPLS